MSTLHGFVARLRSALASIDLAFCKLNRIQFAAPWKEQPRSRC